MKELGTVHMTPASDIPAGTLHTWRFEFVAGPAGLETGGSWRLLIPHGFSTPIIRESSWPAADSEPNANDITDYLPYDLGFLRIEKPESCRVELRLLNSSESFRLSVSGQNGRFVICKITEGHLRSGDRIAIIYGDTRSGSAGASSPSISQTVEFSCAVDPDGKESGPDGGYWQLPSPRAHIIGGEVASWDVISSSQADVRNRLKVVAVPRDKYGNPCFAVQTSLLIGAEGSEERREDAVAIRGLNQSYRIDGLEATETGRRIVVEDREHSLKSRSNPVVPGGRELNVYWGDLHCHTGGGNREELAEELFQYARDIANLDFCAYTPHEDFPVKLTGEDWKTAQNVTGRYNMPGTFVSFIGYEYRNRGDYIVLYDREGQPFFPGMVPTSNTPDKLFRFLDREVTAKFMMIPHLHYLAVFQDKSSGLGVLDVNDLTDKRIRNVEMYSMHGSAEYPGCRYSQSGAIARGYSPRVSDILGHLRSTDICFGFTASTDTHTGNPGNSRWLRNRVQYRGGVTAVLAKSLTRDEVWDSLWHRRTYATTGARILLDFTVNDRMMGERISLDVARDVRKCRAKATGADRLEKITIIRNGEEVLSREFDTEEAVLEWVDSTPLQGKTFYYLRVEQRDGEMAWSSPVWIS